jgi:hypothetical protein
MATMPNFPSQGMQKPLWVFISGWAMNTVFRAEAKLFLPRSKRVFGSAPCTRTLELFHELSQHDRLSTPPKRQKSSSAEARWLIGLPNSQTSRN